MSSISSVSQPIGNIINLRRGSDNKPGDGTNTFAIGIPGVVVDQASFDALASVSVATQMVISPGTYTVAIAGMTIPSYVSLYVPSGVTIDLVGILAINGPFEAGLYQVFSGSGTVVFASGTVEEVYPELWGINTTPGTTDVTTAVQAAVTAYKKTYLGNRYKITTKITVPDGHEVYGTSGLSRIDAWGCDGFFITGDDCNIHNMSMYSYNGAGVLYPLNKTAIGTDGVTYRYRTFIRSIVFEGWQIMVRNIWAWYTTIEDNESNTAQNTEGVRWEDLCIGCISKNNKWTVTAGTAGNRRGHNFTSNVNASHQESVSIISDQIYGSDIGINLDQNIGTYISGNTIDAVIAIQRNADKSTIIVGNPYLYSFGVTIDTTAAGSRLYFGARIMDNFIQSTNGVPVTIRAFNDGNMIIGNQIIAGDFLVDPVHARNAISVLDSFGNIITGNNITGDVYLDPASHDNTVKDNAFAYPSFITSTVSLRNIIKDNTNIIKPMTGSIRGNICDYFGYAVPTTGTYNNGDRIWNQAPAAGASPGWICTKSGTYSAASTTGTTTSGGNDTITGVADTSAFNIGDYIETNDDSPAYTPFVITAKTVNTITVYQGVFTAGGAGKTIVTPDPVFTAMPTL